MTSEGHDELFDKLGVEYLDANRYIPISLSARDVRRTFYYRRNRREFEALETRYGLQLNSYPEWFRGLQVRYIGGSLGYGLFTEKPLISGDLVGEYTGIVRPAKSGRPLAGGGYSTDYSWGFPRVRNLGRSLEIDAREAGGLLRFANHSDSPSARPDHFTIDGRWRIVFIAERSINPGEEITVNYGDAYWSGGERELVDR